MKLYKIDISSGRKIDEFVKIIQENNIEGDFQDAKDSPRYVAKGNSMLGALSTMDWAEVWYWCEQDIENLIKDYLIQKVEV